MQTTLVKERSGKITQVRGSFKEVFEGFEKRGATLKKSRTGNGNFNIWIKGHNMGQLITPDNLKSSEELEETRKQELLKIK